MRLVRSHASPRRVYLLCFLGLFAFCCFLRAVQSNSAHSENAGLSAEEHASEIFRAATYIFQGYSHYTDELEQLHTRLKEFCHEVSCLSCTVDMEITYLRIRKTRPELVWEISPHSGFSSFVILQALNRNGVGKLVSFDTHNTSALSLSRYPELLHNWQLNLGDVVVYLRNNFERIAHPDYLFLDSQHSEMFAMFYTGFLLPRIQKKHTYVSLHDVYNPLFWTDLQTSRNLDTYPESMANLEGGIVIDWLAYPYLSDSCNLHTAAKSKPHNHVFRTALFERRQSAGLVHTVWNGNPQEEPLPTIYFELGCATRRV